MKTTQQAQAEKVSGHDVYRGDHIFYVSEINRKWGVAQLCQQAYWLASDAAVIRYRSERRKEADVWKQWIAAGGDITKDSMPSSIYGMHLLEHRFLDYYKLGGALELALKARLLNLGYVLHFISRGGNSDIHSRQKREPIEISEFNRQYCSYHDGNRNFFPDLTERSINFDLMLSEAGYQIALGLTDPQVQFFDEVRKRRNLMHLPVGEEAIVTPFMQALGEGYTAHLLGILDEFIVDVHAQHRTHGDSLPHFAA